MWPGTILAPRDPPMGRPTRRPSIKIGVPKSSVGMRRSIPMRDAQEQYSGFVAFLTSKPFVYGPRLARSRSRSAGFVAFFFATRPPAVPVCASRRSIRDAKNRSYVRHAQRREIRESRTHRYIWGDTLVSALLKTLELKGVSHRGRRNRIASGLFMRLSGRW